MLWAPATCQKESHDISNDGTIFYIIHESLDKFQLVIVTLIIEDWTKKSKIATLQLIMQLCLNIHGSLLISGFYFKNL